jgi:hypothetical protein
VRDRYPRLVVRLVDHTFAVLAATNCDYPPLYKLTITAGVNLKERLPAKAGEQGRPQRHRQPSHSFVIV